jgi:hypothetical protein
MMATSSGEMVAVLVAAQNSALHALVVHLLRVTHAKRSVAMAVTWEYSLVTTETMLMAMAALQLARLREALLVLVALPLHLMFAERFVVTA